MHRRLGYMYLFNVPSFSSRYFNKIKRTSRLGRLLALSLEILTISDSIQGILVNAEMVHMKQNVSEYDQEISQSHTADQLTTS